jgi:hypothetical protein
MSRNGSGGQPAPRPPARRAPADQDPYQDQYAAGPAWSQGHQPPSYDPHGQYDPHAQPPFGQSALPPQHGQNYYFPQPADSDPNYGYPARPVSQALPFDRFQPGPPQHGQAPGWDPSQPRDSSHYDLGSYLPMGGAEPRGLGQGDPFQPATDSPFRHHGGGEHGYGDADGAYDEMEDEEEPRRGRRGLVIASALVGAIGLGGAMAYMYTKIIAPPRTAPMVKVTDQGPTKVKPALPGGKEFAHTDKKLLNRLDEDNNASLRPAGGANEDRAGENPNAPRPVRSITIVPPGSSSAANAGPASPPVVPGITLENMGPPGGSPGSARVQIPSPPPMMPAKAVAPAGPPPVKIVSSAPPPAALPPAAPAVSESAPPPPAPKRTAAVAPQREQAPRPAAPVATSSTGGYVAVLSSQKSRMDALKVFADLQQKYSGVLSSKTPDVQEANLGDKGIWYRAVVGPPASRDAASGVCSQLKSAGYTGCWVTAY